VVRSGRSTFGGFFALCVAMRGCAWSGLGRGSAKMPTHTLGKHPICHTSRLRHDGLGSHLNPNVIYICLNKARTNAQRQNSDCTAGTQPAKPFEAQRQHLCMARSQPLDSNTTRESQVSNTLPMELLGHRHSHCKGLRLQDHRGMQQPINTRTITTQIPLPHLAMTAPASASVVPTASNTATAVKVS
jgi:hypothetical protein